MNDEPLEEGVFLKAEMAELRSSSLMVNVDYLELVDRVGEPEAWETLGKLKDLLG